MKFSICTVFATVVLLSITITEALPHHNYHRFQYNHLEARRSFADIVSLLKSREEISAKYSQLKSRPQGEEYDRFEEIFFTSLVNFGNFYYQGFADIYQVCSESQDFNSTVLNEIDTLVTKMTQSLVDTYFKLFGSDIDEDTPMPQVAVVVNAFVVDGFKTVLSLEESIESLVEIENPDLLPRIQSIYALAEEGMTLAWTPTLEHVDQFMPTLR